MARQDQALDLDDDFTNGLLLSNTYIPEEIVANVLTFVDWNDLLRCRLVCSIWKRLIDSAASSDKLRREKRNTLHNSFTNPIVTFNPESIPFNLYFAISQDAFGCNLLKNPSGSGEIPHTCRPYAGNNFREFYRRFRSHYIKICSDENCPKFKFWNVDQSGGDGWKVEEIPIGCDPVPDHLESKSCYVTSYGRCHKEQLITLSQCGLTSHILDSFIPHIEVTEWYARRFDCGATYKLKVSLLNSERELIDEVIKEEKDWLDQEWHEVSHTFKDYGPGVRYLLFEHEGQDTQFWAGHYGSKITGGSVIARIPSTLFETSCDSS